MRRQAPTGRGEQEVRPRTRYIHTSFTDCRHKVKKIVHLLEEDAECVCFYQKHLLSTQLCLVLWCQLKWVRIFANCKVLQWFPLIIVLEVSITKCSQMPADWEGWKQEAWKGIEPNPFRKQTSCPFLPRSHLTDSCSLGNSLLVQLSPKVSDYLPNDSLPVGIPGWEPS